MRSEEWSEKMDKIPTRLDSKSQNSAKSPHFKLKVSLIILFHWLPLQHILRSKDINLVFYGAFLDISSRFKHKHSTVTLFASNKINICSLFLSTPYKRYAPVSPLVEKTRFKIFQMIYTLDTQIPQTIRTIRTFCAL